MAGPPGYTSIKTTGLETQDGGDSYELGGVGGIPQTTNTCEQKYLARIFGRNDLFIFMFNPNDGLDKLREYIDFKLRSLHLENEYVNYQIGYKSPLHLVSVSTDNEFRAIGIYRSDLIIYRERDIVDIVESIRQSKLRLSSQVGLLIGLIASLIFLYFFVRLAVSR